MKNLARFLLNSIVDRPEKVKIKKREEENNSLTFILQVSPEDMGKVIGKRGRTVKALTSLVRIKAIKEGKRVSLEIEEHKG